MRRGAPGTSLLSAGSAEAELTSVSWPVCSPGSWFVVYEGPVSTNIGERLVTQRREAWDLVWKRASAAEKP